MNNKISPLLFGSSFMIIFFMLFNFTITSMAALYIIDDLGSSSVTSAYGVTFYGAGNAITSPLALYLRRRLGFKHSILIFTAIFAIITFLIGLAGNYPLFLTLRFLQGISCGPILSIIGNMFILMGTEEQKNHFLQGMLLIFLTAAVVGAAIGGIIAYEFTWRIIFYLDSYFIVACFILLYKSFKGVDECKEPAQLDWIGYTFFCIGVVSLVTFLSLGQQLDWFRSTWMIHSFLTAVLCTGYFIVRSCYHPYPLLDFTLWKNFSFSFAMINMFFLFSSYFGIVIILSVWLKLDVSYTPEWIAIALLTMGVGALFFLHWIWKKNLQKSLLLLAGGILLTSFSCFYSQRFDVFIDFKRIAIARMLAGFGYVMFLPPLLYMLLHSHDLDKRLPLLTFFQLARVLSSTIGAAIYPIVWQRREAFYHDRLGEELTRFSQLTVEYFQRLIPFQLSDQEMVATIALALDKQSRCLALDDCLYFMGWLTLALLIALIIFRRSCVSDYA